MESGAQTRVGGTAPGRLDAPTAGRKPRTIPGMSTRIPAHWVVQGTAIPTVCGRHGRPETRRLPARISEPIPSWMYSLLVLGGGIIFLIVVGSGRSWIRAAQWPFCDQCLRQRRVAMALVSAGMAVAVAVIVLAVTLAPEWIFFGLFLLLVAAMGLLWCTRSWLSGARFMPQTGWVELPKAHPGFAAQVEAGPEAPAKPIVKPIVKKLNGWWYALLIVGILVAIGGTFAIFDQPVCNLRPMRPGESCHHLRSGIVMWTYESERADAIKGGLSWALGGVLVAIAAVVRVGQWKRAHSRAWAAQSQGQPTP